MAGLRESKLPTKPAFIMARVLLPLGDSGISAHLIVRLVGPVPGSGSVSSHSKAGRILKQVKKDAEKYGLSPASVHIGTRGPKSKPGELNHIYLKQVTTRSGPS